MNPETQRTEPERDARSDVDARTTPGTDPRVDELAREQESRREHGGEQHGGDQHDHAQAGERRPDQRSEVEGRREDGRRDDGGAREVTPDQRASGGGLARSEMAGYHDRMSDVQARFIDDPRGAVEQAGSLVKEAIDRLMEPMRHEGGADTEQMRVAMQRYRQMLESIIEQPHR